MPKPTAQDPRGVRDQVARAIQNTETLTRKQMKEMFISDSRRIGESMYRLEAERRFAGLTAAVYDDMFQHGSVWKNVPPMPKLSVCNLSELTKTLQPELFSPGERKIYDLLLKLPYTLIHNTKAEYLAGILKTKKIRSKTQIALDGDSGVLKGGTNTSLDDKYIHNEDFVFFRLGVGDGYASSNFGPVCLIFKPDSMFERGWVSLNDMLNPATSDSMACFPGPIGKMSLEDRLTTPVGDSRSPFAKPLRAMNSDGAAGVSISRTYFATGKPVSQQIHRAREVFFASHIRPGIALCVMRELRLMGPLVMQAAIHALIPSSAETTRKLSCLLFNLFRPEVKIPRDFVFQDSDLIRRYDAPPAGAKSASRNNW